MHEAVQRLRGARRFAPRGGLRIPPSLVPVDIGSLVHGLCLKPPRILFVPVSGAFGTGEYARSAAIARAARRRWPGAEIHFILSRQAPYAATVPFAATLLDSSPTFHSRAVARLIKEFKPSIVVFDNAGRTAQLRAAHRLGSADCVHQLARPGSDARRFAGAGCGCSMSTGLPIRSSLPATSRGWNDSNSNDWAAPPFDTWMSFCRATRRKSDSIVARVGLKQGGYLLVVPGGGTGHPGANDAAEQFLGAANALAETETVVFVGPTHVPDAGAPSRPKLGIAVLPNSRLRCFSSLPQADLADLLSHARLVVTNGGSTLLQAIACGCACIAVPIAEDQPQRIQSCVAAGVAAAADLSSPGILRVAAKLLHDESARAALAQRAANLKLANGVEIALNALAHLAETA